MWSLSAAFLVVVPSALEAIWSSWRNEQRDSYDRHRTHRFAGDDFVVLREVEDVWNAILSGLGEVDLGTLNLIVKGVVARRKRVDSGALASLCGN